MEEKLKLLMRHPCGDGLRQKTLRRIAEDCELVKLESGDCLHEANAPLDAMYLVVGGRLSVSTIDIHGKVVRQWFETSGGQFGAVAMTTDQTSNFHCVAEEPSALVKIDRDLFLKTSRQSYRFRLNLLQLLNDTMQQMLFQNRRRNRPRRVAFVHQSSETRYVTGKLIQRLCELGEQPAWLADEATEASAGISIQIIRPSGDSLSTADIEKLIDRVQRKTNRILIDVAANLDASELIELIRSVDQVFWVVTDRNWISSRQPLKTINQRSQALRDKINLLWVLPGDQTHAPQADELRPLISRDFKLSFLEPPPDTGNVLKHGLERLVHHLRGIQIGVALGGGAARGMAHLGVLKALESSGIVVDMIAGTSAGAMSGTVYSAGMDIDYAIERFVHDLRPGWFFRSIPKGDQWYLVHKYRRGQFDPMLRKYLGDATLEQLPVPMHSITVDLIEGRAVMRDTGDAVCSIIESINLPGISVPINRDGRSLIDGGLMNNVPADVLVSLGCNFVIAVSVTAKIKNEFARNKPDTPTDQMRHASTVETILRSYLVQSHGLNEFGVQPADMVIEPDVTRFKLTDFVLTDQLAEVGYRATIDSIPEIKRQLAQLDSALFNSTETTAEQPNL